MGRSQARPCPWTSRDDFGMLPAWLRAAGTLAGASVVTSLPDVSELPGLGLDGWRRWFEEAAVLTMQAVPDEGVAIFFQSDVNRGGLWFDKGAMVSRAAA